MSEPQQKLELRLVTAAELAPYVADLRALEADITYPLADGAEQFRIDHGAEYTPFFAQLGEAYFVLALARGKAVGAAAGVLRRARRRGQYVNTVYICDLKVAPAYRGRGLARDMFVFALGLLRQSRFQKWRLAYGAAMRGARGDVMRSARGLHPARLGHALARLHIYFQPPARLATLRTHRAPQLAPHLLNEGLNLSPELTPNLAPEDFVSTAGRKELRLVSTGEPWPLWHLPQSPAVASPSWPEYLQRCGAALHARPGLTCFALDERLAELAHFLAAQGITPGATCTVYGLGLHPLAWRAAWVHLSTAEI